MKNCILGIILLCISSIALAGTQLAPQTITSIGTGWGAEGVYVNTAEGLSAEGCAKNVARMLSDHVWLKENLSVLLSAFHAQTKVRLYVDGCIGNNMRLQAVSIQK